MEIDEKLAWALLILLGSTVNKGITIQVLQRSEQWLLYCFLRRSLIRELQVIVIIDLYFDLFRLFYVFIIVFLNRLLVFKCPILKLKSFAVFHVRSLNLWRAIARRRQIFARVFVTLYDLCVDEFLV